jgi:DNA-binding winged helix-turn-helix (wHTH) protein
MAEKCRNLAFGPFRLEPANAQLWRGSDRITLPPKPFNVLCHLAERPGELVTKDELLEAVWPKLHISESSLSVAINALRAALGDDSKAPHYIETVTRRGYRFVASVAAAKPQESEPVFLASSRSQLWVGRAGPIDELESLFQEAEAGNRQLVFVTGEAGIGKTTLVEMFLARMFQHQVRILLGRCVEHFGTDEAFLPLLEALQEYCTRSGAASLKKVLKDCAPAWLVQLPCLIDEEERLELQKEVFGATRERMLREYCEFLEALSTDGPVVLVVEDLHWSDYATLDVLSRFARRTKHAPVLIIATFRPADVRAVNHPAWKLRLDLERQALCTEIAIDGLSRAEVEQYLGLRFSDGAIARALAGQIFSRSEGQPLFVVSLADELIARGEIIDVEGGWQLGAQTEAGEASLSHGLREMIGIQIDRLTRNEQRLLEAASVAGAEFSAAIVSNAAGDDVCDAERICETLARKGLMLRAAGAAEWPNGMVAGRYAFLHNLYQEVLYQRLAPGQRSRLHLQLGERLEEGYGQKANEIAAVLALHFEEGREFSKAVRYLVQAAQNSSQRFSNSEAAIYLTRALNLIGRLPEGEQTAAQIMLLHKRAWVRRSAGDFLASTEDLKAMVSCAAAAKELRAEINGLLDLSRFCLYTDRRQCLLYAEQAVAKAQGAEDDVLRALVRGNGANINLMLKGWRDEDAELCRQLVNITTGAADPWILLRRCSLEMVTSYLHSDYSACRLAAKEGMQQAQTIGDQYYFILFNTIFGFALLHLGEWGELERSVSAALAQAEKNSNRQASALCRLTLGWLHAEALDYEGAKKFCAEALEPKIEANPFTFMIGRNLLAKACIGLRDYAGALAQFQEMQRRVEADGIGMDCTIYPHFHSNFCQYWLEIGDLARAQEEAARLYEISVLPPERTFLALSHRLLAKIATAGKKFDEARVHVSRAVAIVEQSDLPLAAWRVYATAASLHEAAGEPAQAAAFRRLSRQVIDRLSESIGEDEPLRRKLLARYSEEALR